MLGKNKDVFPALDKDFPVIVTMVTSLPLLPTIPGFYEVYLALPKTPGRYHYLYFKDDLRELSDLPKTITNGDSAPSRTHVVWVHMCACAFAEKESQREGKVKKERKTESSRGKGGGGDYERERGCFSSRRLSPGLAASAVAGLVVRRLSHSHSGTTSSSCAANFLTVPFSYLFIYLFVFHAYFSFPWKQKLRLKK